MARKHLDLVLSRLDTLVKAELTRKSSRLLGLLRDTKQEASLINFLRLLQNTPGVPVFKDDFFFLEKKNCVKLHENESKLATLLINSELHAPLSINYQWKSKI